MVDESMPILTPDLNRLLGIMARWWDGWSHERIAEHHGLSRQRVQQILASVACRDEVRRYTDDEPVRHVSVSSDDLSDAHWALEHEMADRLTGRQRGALAWRAMGLGATEIGQRMGISAQAADQLIRRGLAHLQRLSARNAEPIDLDTIEFAPIELDDLDSDDEA